MQLYEKDCEKSLSKLKNGVSFVKGPYFALSPTIVLYQSVQIFYIYFDDLNCLYCKFHRKKLL